MPDDDAATVADALRLPDRPVWFAERLLSADDLSAEQDYHRSRRWLHNELVVGSGVVAGLDVAVTPDGTGRRRVAGDGHRPVGPGDRGGPTGRRDGSGVDAPTGRPVR